MNDRVKAILVAGVVAGFVSTAGAAVAPYSQDFEGLVQGDTGALAADGWLVFANVFSAGGAYLYGYGTFPAPNDGAAFCAIANGQGGSEQGVQQLVVFSDYNNPDHGVGNLIEANVFQEQVVSAGNVGETWTFEFQAKRGNIEGTTTALAFIKTLDPASGYAMTNFITVDMTTIPESWGGYSASIAIDSSLVGQILQFGFASTTTGYQGSGIFYDNIVFDVEGSVATEETSWSGVKSLFR